MRYLSSETLSVVIRTRRKKYAYRQDTLAKKMGISRRTYGVKEDRPGQFTLYELNTLAKHLGTTPADLLAEATKEI